MGTESKHNELTGKDNDLAGKHDTPCTSVWIPTAQKIRKRRNVEESNALGAVLSTHEASVANASSFRLGEKQIEIHATYYQVTECVRVSTVLLAQFGHKPI